MLLEYSVENFLFPQVWSPSQKALYLACWCTCAVMRLQAEAAIASKIWLDNCSFNMMKVKRFCFLIVALYGTVLVNKVWHAHELLLASNFQKLAHCLALLPKSKGDEESWSFMIQKILIWLNNHLNDAFQGFEEGMFFFTTTLILVLRKGNDIFSSLYRRD